MDPQKNSQAPDTNDEVTNKPVENDQPDVVTTPVSTSTDATPSVDLSGLETEQPTSATPAPVESELPGEPLPPSSAVAAQPVAPTDTSITPEIADDGSAAEQPQPQAVIQPQQPAVSDEPVAPAESSSIPVTSSNDPTIVPPIVPTPAKPKRKKWLIALIIIVALLIIGGGAAAAYVGYIIPNKPKYVLARALGNSMTASKLHSAGFDGLFTVKDDASAQTFTGKLTGKGSDKAFDATLTLDAAITKVGIELLSPSKADLYVRVTGLEGVPEVLAEMGNGAEAYSPLVNSVNNQWIEINQSLLQGVGAEDIAKNDYSLSDSDAKKIETAYKNHFFLDVTKTYDDEAVNGVMSRHYQAKVNDAELKAFLQEVKAQKIKNLDITQEQIDAITDARLSEFPIEVWISKDTTLITKVAFDYKKDAMALHAEMSLKDINKSVTVTKPADTKTLLQVLGESEIGKAVEQTINQLSASELEGQGVVN